MTVRPLTILIVLSLGAASPAALARDDDAAHRAQLVADLSQAMERPSDRDAGPLADRVAQAAKEWAFQPQTRSGDFDRLKAAVKDMRGLLSAPAATARTGEFAALALQLAPIIGKPAATELVAKLQAAMFSELMRLFQVSRLADSSPANGEPFYYRGRKYGWATFEGKDIIVRWGSPLHRRSGILPGAGATRHARLLANRRPSRGTTRAGSTARGSGGGGRAITPGGAPRGAGEPPSARNDPLAASQSDLEVLARICKGEALVCSPKGRVAVLAVVLNRVRSPKFPNTIAGVAHQPYQFSCYNPSQRQRLYYGPVPEECWEAARRALAGEDPTGGADHYFNPYLVQPSWARSMQFLGRIGTSARDTHVFYRSR